MDNMTYDDKAKLMYEKHLERMRNYSKNHREKTRETSKKIYQKIKEDPQKYKLYLEKRRNQYHARKQKKLLNSVVENDAVEVQIIENDDDEIEYKDFTIE
jgi:hypothetical protein